MPQVLAAVLLFAGAPGLAQQPPPPVAASARKPPDTAFLRQYAETRRFMNGRPAGVRITPDDQSVLFLRTSPTSNVQMLYAFDVANGQTRELLTPEVLLKGAEETLSPEEKARRERMRVSVSGFTSFGLSEDGTRLLVPLSGRLYVVDRATGKTTELKTGPGVIDPRLSPDGKQVAYVREHDVYRMDLAANQEKRVTQGGTAEKTHGLAEFVAQEEMNRFNGYWWSPDARSIAYTESDTSGVEKLTLADMMHPEQGAQSVPYPRPGKANAKVRLGVTPVSGGKTVWAQWDAQKYPYLATVKWDKGGPLTLVVQNRLQTEEQVLAVDPATGKTRVLLTEQDKAWINLQQQFPLWLEDGSGFLWYTERNGAAEVELRKATGELDRSVVKPGAGFRGLARFVQSDKTLFFSGDPNPTESHLWRVKAGGAPERVATGSTGPGIEMGMVSNTGGLVVLNSQGPKSMPRTFVLKGDGTKLGELPEVAQEPGFTPNFEVRQVGAKKFWTSLVKPRDFKPGTKLPVIVDIYAGPITTVVYQSMAAHLLNQWMADQGFLVVKVDGRGTPLRTAEWNRAVKHDFATITLDDQIEAVQALAKEVPELDLQRVGITGWSFGGYMAALAVMKRPDFFKAAVAGALVADWRDYDTHATERCLGLPEETPQAYEVSSLLTYAKKEGPIGALLMLHGTADDNVYFFHALKLSDALFRAGKPHQLLPLSGFTHMVMEPLAMQRENERVMAHFQQYLK
ncbi:S9 family peptidase [Corallococcus llansteffanensis]|uniref:S9 family peptidase n=1 Tax=Corallococcus llansteffanensis TaxID=2316731 RepID=A0A3A8P9N0_9BACT|nr:S9 family peptidase [Corallococcus llansteffanensis]RKH53186.1 S9 family peptidase [Corallococcus llansteffanensis]